MTNINNYGKLTGRLARDPILFPKCDDQGVIVSYKAIVRVAVKRGYVDKNGTDTDFIDVMKFLAADSPQVEFFTNGIKTGDLVDVLYTVKNNNYTDASGEMHYNLTLQINQIEALESKGIREARRERRAKAEAGRCATSSMKSTALGYLR